MSFYLMLQNAVDIKRDEEGIPYSWKPAGDIADFTDPIAFTDYVLDNIMELQNAVCFTGSASLIMRCNAYLADELKKAKVLV